MKIAKIAIVLFIAAVLYFVVKHSIIIWTFTEVLWFILAGIGVITYFGIKYSNKSDKK